MKKTNETTHKYSTTWSTNETNHWNECYCGDKINVKSHNFVNYECTVCNFSKYSKGLGFNLLSDDTYEVTDIGTCEASDIIIPCEYNGSDKNIILPNDINGNNYIINDYAFFCSNVTSIIGESSFNGCENLTSITLPPTITNIVNDAFSSCVALKNVYYLGTSTEWSNISMGSNNGYFTNATISYEENI